MTPMEWTGVGCLAAGMALGVLVGPAGEWTAVQLGRRLAVRRALRRAVQWIDGRG